MQQTPVVREAQQGLGSPVEGLGFVHTVPCPQMLRWSVPSRWMQEHCSGFTVDADFDPCP